MTGGTDGTAARFVRTVCRCCTAGCGVVAEVRGTRVVGVRGDPAHPASRGYLCPKGHELPWSHHRSDRLDHPTVHGEPASWDDALGDVADRLRRIVADHGSDAWGWFLGNGSPADHLGGTALLRLGALLGSTRSYSAATIDIAPSYQMAEFVTGTHTLLPRWRWDDEECRLLLWLGGNPAVSHGYQTLLPDPVRRIRAFRERGGRLWVVDPRATHTASLGDHHLAIRPGTDASLLAFLVREVLGSTGPSDAFLESTSAARRTRIETALSAFSLERTASETGLPSQNLRDLGTAVRTAGRLAVVAGTGITFQRDALLTEWLRWLLLLVTDSLDAPGGMWFTPGWFTPLDLAPEPLAHRPDALARSPARPELARVAGQLAADVEAGHLRGLVVSGANPAVSFPDPDRTSAALRALDLLVVLDVLPSATTALATHVLPVAGQLERMDVVQVSNPRVMVAPPVADATDEEELSRAYFRAGRQDLGDPMAAGPDGIALPVIHSWVRERVLPGGRWSVELPDLVARLEQRASRPPASGDGLRFVAGRRLRRNGSLDFVPAEKRRDAPEALVNPEDAAQLGLAAGDLVAVRSAAGALTVRLSVDPSVRRGALTVNQGWAGANVARLVSLADDVDPLTGQPTMSALQVSLTHLTSAPAAEQENTT